MAKSQSLSTIEPKSVAGSVKAPKAYEWVSEKIGTDVKAIVDHVIRQVQRLRLQEDDDCIRLLQASMRDQAKTAAIYGDFSSHVDEHMPIEISAERTDVTAETNVIRHSEAGNDDEVEYDSWRGRRAKVARQVIDKGIERLRQLPFNDFWDQKLWDRLRYCRSQELLLGDGDALLHAVLGNEAASEHERLVAMALADRFAEDIVKAEIIERDIESAIATSETIGSSRSNEVNELAHILSAFLVVAEGDWIKCYKDTLPLSPSWGRKLTREVAEGNDALLQDLRGLAAPCERALEGDDVRGQINETMAKILAQYFPTIIISKLTPATEIVLRTYQAE